MQNLPSTTLFLLKYAGDPKRWEEFYYAFRVVDGNQSIAPVNKFKHLPMLLVSKDAAAISGIQSTDANYSVAIKLLKTILLSYRSCNIML